MHRLGVRAARAYAIVIAGLAFLSGNHARHSILGIAWTAATFVVMVLLATGERRTGQALGSEILLTEGRVTMIDLYLAGAVLLGLVLNAAVGWWWADPAASLVVIWAAMREARQILVERR